MSTLAHMLDWKFNSTPGIETKDGVLTKWPVSLGTFPTDTDIATWTAEYNAFLASKAQQSADDAAAIDEVRLNTKLATLKAMTPAQLKTWIDNNVNNFADAKDLLKTFAVVIHALARTL